MRYEIWCFHCGQMFFAEDIPDECPECGKDTLKYDDTYEDKY